MLKIAYGSDFHFEFYSMSRAIEIIDNWQIEDDAEYIIIAGDLHVTAKKVIATLKYIADIYAKSVLYVVGNHDYYTSSFARENSYFMQDRKNNTEEVIPDYLVMQCTHACSHNIHISGCTGNIDGSWKPINKMIHGTLNDFHQIVDFHRHEDMGKYEHDFLLSAGHESLDTIILTHTMPSPKCINPRYEGNYLNPCFANDWEDVIHKIKPNYWICGHTHDAIDMMIGDTRILANPFGYPNENKNWDWKYIEL